MVTVTLAWSALSIAPIMEAPISVRPRAAVATGLVRWMAAASATVRVLFARGGEVRSAQKLLVLLPVALFVQGMLEHYLFVDSYSILNFLFFLFSGYVVRLGRQVSWKQAFPMLARRKKA